MVIIPISVEATYNLRPSEALKSFKFTLFEKVFKFLVLSRDFFDP